MNKYVLGIIISLGVTMAFATPTPKNTPKQDDIPCAKNVDIEKIMEEKGYSILLNMTRKDNNKDGIVESLWVGGQAAVITATVPNSDSSCLILNMNNVVINPNAVEQIWETYKKQTKQKDI